MNIYDLSVKMEKRLNKVITISNNLIGETEGLSSNEGVAVMCLTQGINMMLASCFSSGEYTGLKTLEEVKSWRKLIDPSDNKNGVDHVNARKALNYTIYCMRRNKLPDISRISKIGGISDK